MASSGFESLIAPLAERVAVWAKRPDEFVKDTYAHDPEGEPVILDDPQIEILQAVAEHDRVAVRASHGIGKTATCSLLAHWWLATRKPALVVTLAGTWNHLTDKLWPEIRVWSSGWALKDGFEWMDQEIHSLANKDGVRCKASSSDKPENIEGWHNPNLLVLIDEAKNVPDDVYAAIRGALTQASKKGTRPKLFVSSTPPLAPVGWYSDLFRTKSEGWRLIHVPAKASKRVSQEWIDEMARDFGPESAVYQSKVDGDVPEGNATSVIHMKWVERAMQAEPRLDNRRPVLTCDVARDGEDLTVIGQIHEAKFAIRRWRASNDTMTCAAMCREEVIRTRASMLIVDDTGVGGGVTDRLLELQREERQRVQKLDEFDKDDKEPAFPLDCTIVPVKFGASAERDDRFANTKSELWWTTRDALKEGRLILPTAHEIAALQLPRGSDLRAQLVAPIYDETSRNQILVIDHVDTTDRREKYKALPRKSPDLAHALILGVRYYFRQKPEVVMPTSLVDLRSKKLHDALKRKVAEKAKGGNGVGNGGFL